MYPITFEVDFNPRPNRWTTFFRLILAIPWLIVAVVYLIAFVFTLLFAWVSVVILGRYPVWLYSFNSGVVRYMVRTYAWAYLQTDAWPPFGIGDDPSYPIRVNFAPAPVIQSRLKAFFRPILVIPAFIVAAYGVNWIHAGAAYVAWLTIVFRGYLPEWINSTLTFTNSFYSRIYGYYAILTDAYPPVGIEVAKAPEAPAAAPPAPSPPPAPEL